MNANARARPRAAQRNGTPATPARPTDAPLRIFGAQGAAFTLGGETYHYARLTMAGVLAVQEYIGQGFPAMSGDTIGDQLVEGCLASNNFAPLQGLLERVTDEPVPADMVYRCEVQELKDAINGFIKHSGLSWLERVLGNLTARAAQILEQRIASALAEQFEETKTPLAVSVTGQPPVS